MKTLSEVQGDLWRSINASLKAAGAQELPESHRSAVYLAAIEVYNALKPPVVPKHPMQVRQEQLRKHLRESAVPIGFASTAILTWYISSGHPLVGFSNTMGLAGAVYILYRLWKAGRPKK